MSLNLKDVRRAGALRRAGHHDLASCSGIGRQPNPRPRLLVLLMVFLCLFFPPTKVFAQRVPTRERARKTKAVLELPRLLRDSERHRFWDRTNVALFAGVGAVRALDFTSTRYFRARGYNEALLTNKIVDNAPLFASIEAAATTATIGVSYWLHRAGHHRLERWVCVVHIGVGVGVAARNYRAKVPLLRTPGL